MFEYLFCLSLINVALYQSIFPLEGSFPPILYKKESLEFALSIIRILKMYGCSLKTLSPSSFAIQVN